MARFYLETSFVSACVSTRLGMRAVYQRENALLWWQTQAPKHELFVSAAVLAELSAPGHVQRVEALDFIRRVPLIEVVPEMTKFMQELIRQKLMPQGVTGDALHVAVATVARMDYLLTWNVKHLANPNKVLHLHAVCQDYRYIAPRIVRPDDLVELKG
jgi:maltodextrin utilization protein YvdJ